jgi:hypothetical protein
MQRNQFRHSAALEHAIETTSRWATSTLGVRVNAISLEDTWLIAFGIVVLRLKSDDHKESQLKPAPTISIPSTSFQTYRTALLFTVKQEG